MSQLVPAAGVLDHRFGAGASYTVGIEVAQGLRLRSAGSHPFSLFERQRIMQRDRYRALIDTA